MITQNLVLNMIPDGIRPKVYLSQGDTGNSKLRFHLISEGSYYEIPSGTSVLFLGKKPDHRAFTYGCTYSGHVVRVDVTEQMTNVPGYTECEVRLVDTDDNVVGSVNIDLVIERTPFTDVCVSSNDFNTIDTAVTETAANAAIAQNAADHFIIDYVSNDNNLTFTIDNSDET